MCGHGIGVNGNPGAHATDGHQAVQRPSLSANSGLNFDGVRDADGNDGDNEEELSSSPTSVPGGAQGVAQGSQGHVATWQTMFPSGKISDHEASILDNLDPKDMFNMRDGNGCLPDLSRGAASGNGTSIIVPNRPVKVGDLLFC